LIIKKPHFLLQVAITELENKELGTETETKVPETLDGSETGYRK